MIVPAGRINKLFGTEGGVMLSLYPAFPEDFTTDTPLRVTIDALEVPLWCERFERRGQSGSHGDIRRFRHRAQGAGTCRAGIPDRDERRRGRRRILPRRPDRLRGRGRRGRSLVRKAATAARETGSCASGKLCGTVTDYYDSDANPLFELEIGGRQVLVPAVEEFIARIDFEGRTMHLVLPEGLLTLE